MATATAERMCPDVVRLPPRHERYREVSARIREVFQASSELVEPLSLDECLLDVTLHCTSQRCSLAQTAREIKTLVQVRTGLTASAGGGPNKFLAKIASDLEKPDGLVIVPPHRVREFLAPLPVERVWGVGPVTAARLRESGVRTIGDLARRSPAWLELTFGRWGTELARLARGQDERPVVPNREPKSLSAERTFARDVADARTLLEELADQAAEVADRLRGHEVVGRTVTLKLRYSDFTTITRSRTCSRPLEQADDLRTLAEGLLTRTEFPERPVRLVGLGVSGLVDRQRPVQLELFDHEE